MKRKICVITGTRAEYGLLYWLLKGIKDDPDLELQIVVTGMHLSPEFGLTYREIESDGFHINRKVEMLLSADAPSAISKSTGLGIIGFADAFADLRPDLIAILGDRFEILAAAIAASFANIPIAHFHGGETTEGSIDESIRHSVTKMSHLHFVAADEYVRRVKQLGEAPERIHMIGAMGIENVKRLPLLNQPDLERKLGFQFGTHNLLITFHPVTLENKTAGDQMSCLFQVLDMLEDTRFIFTMPNADAGGRLIYQLIDAYVKLNPNKSAAFVSLGTLKYLSVMQYVDAVVGNSSSGLLEAPLFKIGTINIGDRQKGRIKGSSVIDCKPTMEEIKKAIEKLYSPEFKKSLAQIKVADDEILPSQKAIQIIKTIDLKGIIKKSFHFYPPPDAETGIR